MIRDHAPKEKGDGKMCAKFVGPFWVIDKLGDVNYRIQQTEEGRPQVVHHNRMKPYTSRQPVTTDRNQPHFFVLKKWEYLTDVD